MAPEGGGTPPSGTEVPDVQKVNPNFLRLATGSYFISTEKPLTSSSVLKWGVPAVIAVFAGCFAASQLPISLFQRAYAQDQQAIDARFKAEKERRESLETTTAELRKDMAEQKQDIRETKGDVKQIKAALETYFQAARQPKAAAKLQKPDAGTPRNADGG